MRAHRIIFVILVLIVGCKAPDDPETVVENSNAAQLKEAITLYASFDEGFEADFAAGDPRLYTAPNWQSPEAATVVGAEDESVTYEASGGKFGGALRFHSNWDPIVFYRADKNLAYTTTDWAGAFSFWLKVIPDEELEDGYSDPFIVTDKNWDNASLYVDFTEEDRPRRFRFAVFSDRSFWNPEEKSWEDVAVAERPMISTESAPFATGQWTHVVLSFSGLNSDEPGIMTGYINGERKGHSDDRIYQLSWTLDQALMALGRHYTGQIDELAVFNRSLSENEVSALYRQHIKEWF